MARKSRWRKETLADAKCVASALTEKCSEYSTAIYVRLSVYDLGRDDSETLENQIALLKHYISQHPDLRLTELYIDNGWSGTNFSRPEFQRMVQDVYVGKINCIIVKDLSRLGRNHLETAYYLQSVFAEQHIRFISVNDGFDSLTGAPDSIEVIAKNIINDYYSKDISRKVSASLDLKRSQGIHNWGHAPYGYIRTSGSPNTLQLDPEVSAYVRLIFHWAMEGISFSRIAARLTKLGAPTFMRLAHRRKQGRTRSSGSDSWSLPTVKEILLNQTYAGDYIYQKSYDRKYDPIHKRQIPEDEWIIIPDTHPAYIDRDDFFAIKKRILDNQEAYSQRRIENRAVSNQDFALFKGIIYCGQCGRRMIVRRSTAGKPYTAYYCKGKKTLHCEKHRCITINATTLNEIVMMQINLQIRCAVDTEKLLCKIRVHNLDTYYKEEQRKKISILQRNIAASKISRLEAFEQLTAGEINEEEYQQLMHHLMEKQAAMRKQCEDAEALCNQIDQQLSVENTWLRCFSECGEISNLTPELVSKMIKQIDILEDKRVHITFNYTDCMVSLLDCLHVLDTQ